MKKQLFALLLTAFALNASAQYISPFFTSMPEDIANYLNAANRKDLIDLYKAGKTARVENLLKGQSELKELADDQLTLQMNESAILQMKLLPLNDTAKVIAVIRTACAPACDSKISFFTSNWKSLKTSDILPNVSLSDFILADKKTPETLEFLDIPFYSYAFSKNKSELIITLDVKNFLGKEDLKKIEPMLKPVVSLRWNKGQFVKE
jgi:Protein of unknown function (DUF3256).